MFAKPVLGWDNFLERYYSMLRRFKRTTTTSSPSRQDRDEDAPIECPDGIIHPKHAFGQQPPPSTTSIENRPRVSVYAPGCTPGPSAAGVDHLGIWYDARHDECPARSIHRHDWTGGVYFPPDNHQSHSHSQHSDTAAAGHDETVRTCDEYQVKADTRCAEVAARYLAALRRVGMSPGPMVHVFTVLPDQSQCDDERCSQCDDERCGGGGGGGDDGGMWSPHVPTTLPSFAEFVKGCGLLPSSSGAGGMDTTGERSRGGAGEGDRLDRSRRSSGPEPEQREWRASRGTSDP
jgi:hypothetical protein